MNLLSVYVQIRFCCCSPIGCFLLKINNLLIITRVSWNFHAGTISFRMLLNRKQYESNLYFQRIGSLSTHIHKRYFFQDIKSLTQKKVKTVKNLKFPVRMG